MNTIACLSTIYNFLQHQQWQLTQNDFNVFWSILRLHSAYCNFCIACSLPDGRALTVDHHKYWSHSNYSCIFLALAPFSDQFNCTIGHFNKFSIFAREWLFKIKCFLKQEIQNFFLLFQLNIILSSTPACCIFQLVLCTLTLNIYS